MIAVIGLGGLALLAWQGAAFGWPIPGDRQRRELEKQFTAAAQRKDFSTAVKQCDAALALTTRPVGVNIPVVRDEVLMRGMLAVALARRGRKWF